jgi:hypothetical protein
VSLPNFLIIGAAKAGTNALYHYLRQHPQVYMSPWKEPKFFAFESEADLGFRAANGRDAPVNASVILDQAEYEELFDDARDDELARGEASTHYLYVERSPARIKALIPDAKLIAVLRNPVDRAFSSYQHLVRDDLEPLDFGAALDAEPQRIAEHYAYLYRYTDMGFYSEQLDRYEKTFPENQLCVLLYDDLRSDPEGTCRRIFSFLGVDEDFVPDMSEKPVHAPAPQPLGTDEAAPLERDASLRARTPARCADEDGQPQPPAPDHARARARPATRRLPGGGRSARDAAWPRPLALARLAALRDHVAEDLGVPGHRRPQVERAAADPVPGLAPVAGELLGIRKRAPKGVRQRVRGIRLGE